MEKSLVGPFLMTKKEVCHIFSPATFLHFLKKLQPATLVTYKRTPPLLFHKKLSKRFQNTPEKQILNGNQIDDIYDKQYILQFQWKFSGNKQRWNIALNDYSLTLSFWGYIWNPNFISRLFAMPQKIKDTWIWLYLSCRHQL